MSCEIKPAPLDAVNPPALVPPAPGMAFLIALPDGCNATRTTIFNVDAVAAMQRGLKDYLDQIESEDSGAPVRFMSVDTTWAEPNEDAVYPSAAVLLEGEPEFEPTGLSTSLYDDDVMPDGTVVDKRADVTAMFRIVAHCATPGERNIIARMLEVALNPVHWMAGFWLELPFYGGQRATFLPVRAEYRDDEVLARHNLRPVIVFLEGRVSEVVPRNLPKFQPRIDVSVTDPLDVPNAEALESPSATG